MTEAGDENATATGRQLRFLFVPVSGPGGAGEYFRALAVARGIERRWPGCSIKFVVSRDATYSQGVPYPVLLVERSPTFETDAVRAILESERPHVVVFDSAGRVAQYRAARAVGARVVFVSSRATTRRKGFRLRRMSSLDQHWIAQPRFLGGSLSRWERWKSRLARQVEVVFLEVLNEPVDEQGTRDLQLRLGLRPGEYVLACPGGAGVFGKGPDAPTVFYAAAERVTRSTGLPVVAVLGTRFTPPAGEVSGLHALAALPNGVLMGMLRDARIGIVNGGSLLLQAMAQRTPCVAAPISEDQPDRIAKCAALGYARAVPLAADAIASAVESLAADEARRTALVGRLAALDLRNGVDVAVEAVARLLPRHGRRAVGRDVARAPRRLRIMQVLLSRGFAGSERAAAEACNQLCTSHDVVLVLRSDHRSPGGASIRDFVDSRVEVVEVSPFVGTRRKLASLIREWRPDVIHTHLRRGTRYVAQIESGVPHICTLHLSLNGPHYLRADGVVCISEWQVTTLPKTYAGQVFLIPNSLVPQPRLSPERVEALRRELGAGPGEFLIGGAGRLAYSKGFDVLIRAFRNARLEGARLVIVGEGSERASLEKLAAGQARLTGFRDDVKDCYQAFDLFVSPSRREPFGRVIVEALDGGAPVIASDAQGPLDLAQRYPIEIVPREDEIALAAALRRACDRPRTRVSVDLSEFALEHVGWQLVEAYYDVLAAHAKAPPAA